MKILVRPTRNLPLRPPPPPCPWWVQPPRKRSFLAKIGKTILVLFVIGSILLNLQLLVLMSLEAERALRKTVIEKGQADQTVAVYTISDMIGDETAQQFAQFCRLVRYEPNIKAIVLRIDSPGGAVSSSDQIHRMVRDLRKQRDLPIVVSMGGVAASGAYYIAAAADTIFAEPTTVTGSIGVLAVWPVLAGLMDRHGVEIVTIRSSESQLWKARQNFWESPDEKVKQNVLRMLDSMHETFRRAVVDGRGERLKTRKTTVSIKTPDGGFTDVEQTEPFTGEVYLPDEAAELGLIDRIGYLSDATAEAASLAKLDDPNVVTYTPHRRLIEQLVGTSSPVGASLEMFDRLTGPRIMMLWKPE